MSNKCTLPFQTGVELECLTKKTCLSSGFTWVLWREKGEISPRTGQAVRKLFISNPACESMLLCSCVKERQGTLFVTPMQDCEVHNSQLKRVKWCPFPTLHLCLFVWEMRREQSVTATVAYRVAAVLGHESRGGFGCCKDNSLLPKGWLSFMWPPLGDTLSSL